jgi:hypothetical protein
LLLPPPTATSAYVGGCSPDGCVLLVVSWDALVRQGGRAVSRGEQVAKSTMGSRVISPSPSPTLLFSMRRGAGSVRAFGQTISVVYKEYALSCWSLPACHLLVSLVGTLVARLGCIPTLTPAFIMFSHQCRYDHPRAMTSMGTFDLLSAFAQCLRSALLPSFESNGCRPLTLLPFPGSSIRSSLGDLYK